MIALRTAASMRSAVLSDLHPSLRALLALRINQLSQGHNLDLSEVVEFLIVEAGDSARVITDETGIDILTNLVDGSRFGEAHFTPSFDWLIDHHRYFEIVFLCAPDFATLVLVPDDPGIEFDLHSLCLEYAGRAECP